MTNLFDDMPWQEYDELDDLEDDRPGLSLSLEQQTALAAAVTAQMRTCDGSLRAAREWADGAGVGWAGLKRELEASGGFCDCEVVFNVFGGDLDPAVDDPGGATPG